MDVVVRTPHGDADIDIVAAPVGTTLHDLVLTVTGQAPPAAARVDGRVVATSHPLAELGLVVGSMVDTRPITAAALEPDVPDRARVGVLQLTGRGAGRVVELGPGRHRIGSARRAHALELEAAPVETLAFELVVDEGGDVRVVPGTDIGGALGVYTPTLDGQLLDRELPWTTGRLHVGGRTFELERPLRPAASRRLPEPLPDGTIPFQRAPWAGDSGSPLVVGALRGAQAAAGALWQRRPTDAGAFQIPFGLHADGVTVATIDLQRHRGVAIVGSERFATSLARTLLVEACTIHGPADLAVVIASTPEHIAHWNWAKWLPHVRDGDPTGSPRLFDDPHDIAAWAGGTVVSSVETNQPMGAVTTNAAATPAPVWSPPTPVTTRSPITLLVLDDISLWSRRDSPIRSLLVDPPPYLRVMALCVGLHEAPGMCTTLIEEVPPADRIAHLSSITTASATGRPALFGSLASQHVREPGGPQILTDIRPALTETSIAGEIARQLAPLDDLDLRRRVAPPTTMAPPTLDELVEASTMLLTPPGGLRVAIGLDAVPTATPTRVPVTVDLTGPDPTVIAANNGDRHDRTLAALVLGAAIQRRPDQFAVLVIGRERPAWHSELPHLAGWAGREEANDAERLVLRVAHVLLERPELSVMIVIEHAFDRSDPVPPELVSGMNELAASLPNVHVVLSADSIESVPDSMRERAGAFVSILSDGTGTVVSAHGRSSFVAVAATESGSSPPTAVGAGSADLLVRPTSHGRAMTPLERRLSRATQSSDGGDDLATAAIARRVTSLLSPDEGGGDRPSLLPPPLPAAISEAALLARHHGDGVPIGLVDRPERAGNEAYWWQPGPDGSILAAGSPRSGMTALIDLVITGVAARLSADDVHVYAIESLPQRRRALSALPHTGSVVTPGEPTLVVQLVQGLHRLLDERLATRDREDRSHLVLLIGDVGRMRRALPADRVASVMDQLADLAAAGSAVGINVIAITTRLDDLGPLTSLTGDRLVAAMSDPDDRTRMGAPAIGPADRHVRRCWSIDAERRVQLATPAESIEREVARLQPEPAHQRPPQVIVGQDAR